MKSLEPQYFESHLACNNLLHKLFFFNREFLGIIDKQIVLRTLFSPVFTK